MSGNLGDHMLRLAQRLYTGGQVTSKIIEKELNVSRATAQRYMTQIECVLPVQTTFENVNQEGDGGAQRRVFSLPKPLSRH